MDFDAEKKLKQILYSKYYDVGYDLLQDMIQEGRIAMWLTDTCNTVGYRITVGYNAARNFFRKWNYYGRLVRFVPEITNDEYFYRWDWLRDNTWMQNCVRGEKNGVSKMTEEKVRKLRKMALRKDMTYRKLGEIFGISFSVACAIANRKLWKHVK